VEKQKGRQIQSLMMKYPIGIQSFEIIRKNGYVYVDKTDLVYKLAHSSKTGTIDEWECSVIRKKKTL